MKKALIAFSLLFVFTSVAYSGELGLKSITGKVGIIMPEDPWDTGFLIGAEADMGELFENGTLHPVLSYWSAGYSISGFDFSLSNFQIGADLHYHIANVPGLYAGGGLGLNFISFEYPSFSFLGNSSTASESDTKLGIVLLAGYSFPISNMNGVVSGRYNIIDGFDTFEIAFGLEFDMTK
jgi:hypothetical protein